MPRPSSTFGEPIRTIFLAKENGAPGVELLSTLVSTAKEHQGYDVELSWALPECTNSIRLLARWLKGAAAPSLKLTEIDGNDRTEIWDGETADLAMVGVIVEKCSGALFITSKAPQMEAAATEVKEDVLDDVWVDDNEEEGEEDERQEKTNDLDFLGEAATSVQVLSDQLINLTTGLHSFSVLLKYLEREFYRFDAYGVPLSLIIFEISHPSISPIPLQAVSTAALRIEMIKRPSDIAGHFETRDFALLLPNTQSPTASLIANKVIQVLRAAPLAPGLDKSTLKFSFGIATLPDDGDDLESLIKSAKAAKAASSIAKIGQS
jgi:hypothetical protein